MGVQHTNNARITAVREFKYKSSNIVFAESQLNLKHILTNFSNSSDIMSNLDNIIQDEISTKAKNMHRIHKDILESGSNLNEIKHYQNTNLSILKYTRFYRYSRCDNCL